MAIRLAPQVGFEPATFWLTEGRQRKGLSGFQSISRIDFGVDFSPRESHACPERTMRVETKFLRLFRAVELGDDIEGWQVCWLGGWDKCRVLFVVMVKRVTDVPDVNPMCRRNRS